MAFAICLKCGNTKRFRGYQCKTEWGSERVDWDEEGDVDEYHGWDCNESEVTEEHVEECLHCGETKKLLLVNDKEQRDYQKYIRMDDKGIIHENPLKEKMIGFHDWKLMVKI